MLLKSDKFSEGVPRLFSDTTSTSKKSHIICPLCTGNVFNCGTYNKLERHLALKHETKLQQVETLHFVNQESYEIWFETEKLDMLYAVVRVTKHNDFLRKSYICNRSNSRGFESKRSRRMEKTGGSIKIHGVCPSRIETKISQTGQIIMKFWKTHVGHEEEMRYQHLSRLDKKHIVKKLCDGVVIDRIISDARKDESEELQRIHLLDKKDVFYLMKKHNICKSVLDDVVIQVSIDEPSEIAESNSEEIQISNAQIFWDKEASRETKHEAVINYLRSLNDEDFDRCVATIMAVE